MRPRTLVLLVLLVVAGLVAAHECSLGVVRNWFSYAMQIVTREHLALPYAAPPSAGHWQSMSAGDRLSSVRSRLLPKLHDELTARGLKLGQPVFIRIFKESRELELWLKTSGKEWRLFRNYPIAFFSGTLGPKTREGDMQAPEGFYTVASKQLNPASSYHLSFNVGYPNAYDRAHQYTGGLIMVHGRTVSIGCFAMTDPLIEEIYLVVEAALKNASSFPVHIFPFRMAEDRMRKAQNSPHINFWQNLRPAFDIFEKDRRVPQITVENGLYQAR
ncbi:MAG: murein L,D-transpeptidase family protein [Verrucomicrobiaceae bacterium]